MSKKGLGRGLGALIPEIEANERENIVDLDVHVIQSNPRQPRKVFDQTKLEELATSIREHGLVQPIVVRPKDDVFEIVAGERRWRAAKLAGLTRIPALVRMFSEAEMMEIALIENLQREDLNPLEEAEAYRILLEEFQQTQEELGKRLGKSRPQISNTLRLLQLGSRAREEIRAGRLSMGHAKVLLGVVDQELQETLVKRVIDDELSVRELEHVLKRFLLTKKENRSARPQSDSSELGEIEGRLREWLGTPVKVLSKGKRGRIEITFFGEEGLSRILDVLGLSDAGHDMAIRPPRGKFHV